MFAGLVALALPLGFSGVAAVGYGALFMFRSRREQGAPPVEEGRAFSIGTAIVLAVTVAMVLIASAALASRFGNTGLIAAAGIAGFADVHAALISTVSLVASGKLEAADAVMPILAALSTNTISKLIVAQVSGGPRYAIHVAPGLLSMATAAWLGWLFQ